jgi:hypothetical protein
MTTEEFAVSLLSSCLSSCCLTRQTAFAMERADENIDIFDSYRQPWTFGILLTVAVPSIVCSLLILIFFFTNWRLMINKALHHHTIFLLTIISFLYTSFDLPFSINYFRRGFHAYRSIKFCLWWYWLDYSLVGMSLFVTATTSVQRYILIFHAQWFNVGKRRLLLHYIPLLASMFYPPCFYFVCIYIYMFLDQCDVYFNPSDGWCAYPCFLDNTILFKLDWLANNISPVVVIVLANLVLFIRVIRSMRRIRRRRSYVWNRQKRLTLQLFAFSFLYVIVFTPTTLLALLRAFALPNLYEDIPSIYYMYHMIYFVCPLQSFLCVFALPELTEFLKHSLKKRLVRSRVAPAASVPSVT